MALAILCILLAAGCIYLLRRKKPSKGVRALLILATVLLLLTAFVFIWLSVYYHADPEAEAYLKSRGSVTVERQGSVWRFDGPGDATALIFYPGAKVEAAAYAPLLYRLAEDGADAFLVEMPCRIAFLDRSAAGRIIGDYAYRDWILAGHSLGGVAAAGYAEKHPDEIAGMVFLASYPAGGRVIRMPMLSVYGDQDKVLGRSSYEKSRESWPASAQELVIPGGNHAGFADYGPQMGDGKATISKDEQQRLTEEAILHWIGRLHTEEA